MKSTNEMKNVHPLLFVLPKFFYGQIPSRRIRPSNQEYLLFHRFIPYLIELHKQDFIYLFLLVRSIVAKNTFT